MKNLPYEVLIHKDQARRAMRWCEEHYGPRWEAIGNRTGIWCCFWAGFPRDKNRVQTSHYRYYFESEEMAMFFTLQWVK